MAITTVLTYFVVRHRWGLPAWLAWGATAFFLLLDCCWWRAARSSSWTAAGSRWCWAWSILPDEHLGRGRTELRQAIRANDGLALGPFLELAPMRVPRAANGHYPWPTRPRAPGPAAQPQALPGPARGNLLLTVR